ncbi:hypothetical protein [Abyssisolibacter fermentans]|uniref:hypothetical protein n=1 Tax=Abyssisolibacter fermentans TaxID=1766203 RepID=UPI00082BD3F0|nr:hypothetical protein [Abyssisolibacter fermentans]
MKKAIRISQIKELELIQNKYDHIYFGDYHCNEYLITKAEMNYLLKYCKERNIGLSVIIPFLFEEDFVNLKEILQIAEYNYKIGIVVNDWGVLKFINTLYGSDIEDKFRIETGILLNRKKKTPITENVYFKLEESIRENLQNTSLNMRECWGLLKQYHVSGVHFENTYNKNNIEENFPFNKILVYPYVNVTLIRSCPLKSIIKENIHSCCRYCNNNDIYLGNSTVNYNVILKGRSIRYTNTSNVDMHMYDCIIEDANKKG